MKALLIVVGWLSIALGAIGLFLPILPTTPFILLAAACFAKSSPRFHAWLLRNKTFGPLIQNWQQHRAVPRHAKRMAIITILVSGALSLYLLESTALQITVALALIIPFWIVLRLPVLQPASIDRKP